MPLSISDISIDQLKCAIAIREQIEALQQQQDAIRGGTSSAIKRRGRPPKIPSLASPAVKTDGRKGKRSAATRAKMKAAQQARWAAKRGNATPATVINGSKKEKRTMSPEARANIAATQRARWAKVKR